MYTLLTILSLSSAAFAALNAIHSHRARKLHQARIAELKEELEVWKALGSQWLHLTEMACEEAYDVGTHPLCVINIEVKADNQIKRQAKLHIYREMLPSEEWSLD